MQHAGERLPTSVSSHLPLPNTTMNQIAKRCNRDLAPIVTILLDAVQSCRFISRLGVAPAL
jgi:hypothetical protein